MKKTNLIAKTKSELLRIAKRLGLRGITTLKKTELAAKIVAAKQQKRSNSKRQPLAAVKKAAALIRRRAIRKRAKKKAATPVVRAPSIARKRKSFASKTAAKPAKTTAKATKKAEPVAAGASSAKEKRGMTATVTAVAMVAHKFDVSPKAKAVKRKFVEESLGELPKSYGTGKLFMVARDPSWLYVYWDLTDTQLAEARSQAADGRLLLRVFEEGRSHLVQELPLDQDSHNWYVSGVRPSTAYRGQLGYRRRDGQFHVINQSGQTTTPSAEVSSDTTTRFVTIPIELPVEELTAIVESYRQEGEPLAEALHRLQAEGVAFPFEVGEEVGSWTAEQEAAILRAVGGGLLRAVRAGSMEISESLRRRLEEELNLGGAGLSAGGASWSAAPGETKPRGKGFRFAVNAELIIYGATEPGAKVMLDGREIALQEDGSFSFHYALPDGQYRVPLLAVSEDGSEKRAADLSFERRTATSGEVRPVTPTTQRPNPS